MPVGGWYERKGQAFGSLLVDLIGAMRSRLSAPEFCQRHRLKPCYFTRNRLMRLPRVVLFILQKTTRSIQRHLHDFLRSLDQAGEPLHCTAGAWSQARAKLSHRAFVELNDELLIPAAYGASAPQDALKLWRTHRLVGFDGSLLHLPKSTSVIAEFGVIEAANQLGQSGVARCMGRLSLAFDVLNRLGWDMRLSPVSCGEVDMAAAHLDVLKPGDVALVDRGYTGFGLLARMSQRGVHMVARCSSGSFGAAQELFRRDAAGLSLRVWLKRPAGCLGPQVGGAQDEVLPAQLEVRFVTVRLRTGELEVLVTTLLDEQKYPGAEFAQLYHLRWNVETFYLMLKSRLELENWSGLTLEAVRQDLAATLLVFNLESLLTRPAQQSLDEAKAGRKHAQQVNRAVAYHALKTHVMELLAGEDAPEVVLQKLHGLFIAAPVTCRNARASPRGAQITARSYLYQRTVKKCVF